MSQKSGMAEIFIWARPGVSGDYFQIFAQGAQKRFAACGKILQNGCPLVGHRTRFSYRTIQKMLRQGKDKK
jgi:hypothetical protein